MSKGEQVRKRTAEEQAALEGQTGGNSRTARWKAGKEREGFKFTTVHYPKSDDRLFKKLLNRLRDEPDNAEFRAKLADLVAGGAE